MADEIIWGYQRVADGDACEFCAMLDGAQFRTDDPMPIHPGCGCGVEPVEYTRLSKGRKNSTKARRPDAEPAQSVRGNIAPDQEVAVRRAAGEIQDEFGTSETTPSHLTYHQPLKGKRGDYDPKTGAVRVDATKNPVMTYSHEVGHRIDLGMGDGTAYIRGKNGGWVAPWGDEAAAAREELLAAIMKSDAGQGLLKAKKDVHLLWKTPAGRRQNNFRVNYYLRDEELIARAFAQYIGTRPGLREFFDEYFDEYKRSTEWAKGMGEHYNNYTQWEDDDFEAIIPLLKKYMRAAAKAKAENTGLQPGRGTLKK